MDKEMDTLCYLSKHNDTGSFTVSCAGGSTVERSPATRAGTPGRKHGSHEITVIKRHGSMVPTSCSLGRQPKTEKSDRH